VSKSGKAGDHKVDRRIEDQDERASVQGRETPSANVVNNKENTDGEIAEISAATNAPPQLAQQPRAVRVNWCQPHAALNSIRNVNLTRR